MKLQGVNCAIVADQDREIIISKPKDLINHNFMSQALAEKYPHPSFWVQLKLCSNDSGILGDEIFFGRPQPIITFMPRRQLLSIFWKNGYKPFLLI